MNYMRRFTGKKWNRNMKAQVLRAALFLPELVGWSLAEQRDIVCKSKRKLVKYCDGVFRAVHAWARRTNIFGPLGTPYGVKSGTPGQTGLVWHSAGHAEEQWTADGERFNAEARWNLWHAGAARYREVVAHYLDRSKPMPDLGRILATRANATSLSEFREAVKRTTEVAVLMGQWKGPKGHKKELACTVSSLKSELERWRSDAQTDRGKQEAQKSVGGKS